MNSPTILRLHDHNFMSKEPNHKSYLWDMFKAKKVTHVRVVL